MKLPFSWEELTPEDKAWLGDIPAYVVWDFVATLPPDERAPFDADLYAPSGADFMREYGDRLREYVKGHPNGKELTPEEMARINRLFAMTDTEARQHLDRGIEQHRTELAASGELEKWEKTLEDFQRFDPLVITAKRKATAQATRSQGGTDRALAKAYQRIAELEAKVAELTRQRDELLKRLLLATGAKATA